MVHRPTATHRVPADPDPRMASVPRVVRGRRSLGMPCAKGGFDDIVARQEVVAAAAVRRCGDDHGRVCRGDYRGMSEAYFAVDGCGQDDVGCVVSVASEVGAVAAVQRSCAFGGAGDRRGEVVRGAGVCGGWPVVAGDRGVDGSVVFGGAEHLAALGSLAPRCRGDAVDRRSRAGALVGCLEADRPRADAQGDQDARRTRDPGSPILGGGRPAKTLGPRRAPGGSGALQLAWWLSRPQNTRWDVRAALDRAGFDWVTWHSFRKTTATMLDEAGLSARVIADQLGHATRSMTQDVYLARKAVDARVAEALEDALGDAFAD